MFLFNVNAAVLRPWATLPMQNASNKKFSYSGISVPPILPRDLLFSIYLLQKAIS